MNIGISWDDNTFATNTWYDIYCDIKISAVDVY